MISHNHPSFIHKYCVCFRCGKSHPNSVWNHPSPCHILDGVSKSNLTHGKEGQLDVDIDLPKLIKNVYLWWLVIMSTRHTVAGLSTRVSDVSVHYHNCTPAILLVLLILPLCNTGMYHFISSHTIIISISI